MKKSFLKFIIIIIFIFSLSSVEFSKTSYITKVLNSKYYSSLPVEVKDYIVEYYNSTGKVLATEDTKKGNEPYINPDYIYYISNPSTTSLEPPILNVDINYPSVGSSEQLPSSYLSPYMTSPKNQKSTDNCWDFALTSVLESKLLQEGYYNNSVEELDLSEGQITYISSDPIQAIDIGYNPFYHEYALHQLNKGGNEYRYAYTVMGGISPMLESDWNYDIEYNNPLPPSLIWNLDNKIPYKVEKMTFYTDNNENHDELINIIKSKIYHDGGVAVDINVEGKYSLDYVENGLWYWIVYRDEKGLDGTNHEISLVGWDDNYSKNLCISDEGRVSNTIIDGDTETCSSGTFTSIHGAYLIKNSWGQFSGRGYLAYDTVKSRFVTIDSVYEKDWDNVYYYNNIDSQLMIDDYNEELVRISFVNNTYTGDVEIYYNDGNEETLLETIENMLPGALSVDLSNHHIVLNKDSYFKVKAGNDYLGNDYYIFTKNITNNVQISMQDAYFKNDLNLSTLVNNNDTIIVLNGITRNLKSNDLLDFKIYDSNNIEITNKFNISRNYSVSNNINALLTFHNSDVELGTYIGKVYYNNELYSTFNIEINNYYLKLEGDGTYTNPYVITNAMGLDMIRQNKLAYYVLDNDIDMTYDTQDPNGLFYNDGKGWEPIKIDEVWCVTPNDCSTNNGFEGGIEGNNHKITGLYINRPDEDAVGLISMPFHFDSSYFYVRNIVFENVNITGRNYVGALFGFLSGYSFERSAHINNISVIGGSITGNNYVGGIAGLIKMGSSNNQTYLDNVWTDVECHYTDSYYNSASITGNNYVGGITGYLQSLNQNQRSITHLTNVVNVGNVTGNNYVGGIAGYLNNKDGDKVYLENIINTGKVSGNNSYALFNISDEALKSKIYLNNIYYVKGTPYNNVSDINISNVSIKNISELTQSSTYNNWNNFNDKWKIETIDGISRIPVLKNLTIPYTSISNIEINENSTDNIINYITPDFEAALNMDITSDDESKIIVNTNGGISALKDGISTLTVTSYYDGYVNDITVTINNVPSKTITYNSNNSANETINQSILVGITANLNNNIFTYEGYTFNGWNTKADGSGTGYADGQEVTLENDLVLYAQWIEDYSYHINTYTEDQTSEYIMNIPANTSVSQYTSNFDLNDGYTMEMEYKTYNSINIVYTGSKTRIYKNLALFRTLINIVKGDSNGDGLINSGDLLKVRQHLIGTNTLLNEYAKASDLNGDNQINSGDLLKVRQYLLGIIQL